MQYNLYVFPLDRKHGEYYTEFWDINNNGTFYSSHRAYWYNSKQLDSLNMFIIIEEH